MHHHVPDIFEEMRRVRVFFRITVGMVHPVHHRIGPGYQIGRSLEKPGHKVKGLFPKRIGQVHLVRGIAVEKKGVKKQGEKPMQEEKSQNNRHVY